MGLFDFSKSVARALLKDLTEKPPFSDEEYAKIWQPEPNVQMGWKNLTNYNWQVRADHFADLGMYDEAVDCFDVAITLDPQNYHMWREKGNLLSKIARYDEAIECYDNALEINPRDGYVLDLKGECLSKLGRDDEAIQCYDSSLEQSTLNASAWKLKGDSLCKLERYQEAIECYDNAVKWDDQYQRKVQKSREHALNELGKL